VYFLGMATRKLKKLQRAREGRMIAGVAMGLAKYFGVDVVLVRLIWAFLLIPGGFPGILGYVIAWILMPEEI